MAKKHTREIIDFEYEERMSKQRAKRGFSDSDVLSIDYWFCNTISPMLKQLAKKTPGFFLLDEKGNIISFDKSLSTEENEMYLKRWLDMIQHLAFLADEMNENKCSMKNPYDKEWNRIERIFEKKYGFLGEKLQTEEDKKSDGIRMYTPIDDPVNGKEYCKVWNSYRKCEKEIERYREKCKREFFKLFSKYFRYF